MWGVNHPTLLETQNFMTPCYFGAPFFSGNVIEPVMYGVNLKYKKPFIAVCIGGALGGAITGASGAGTVAAVALSIYTFPVYLGAGFGGLMLGCALGGALTFVLTYLMGIDEEEIR